LPGLGTEPAIFYFIFTCFLLLYHSATASPNKQHFCEQAKVFAAFAISLNRTTNQGKCNKENKGRASIVGSHIQWFYAIFNQLIAIQVADIN
jgi:hypothetical protein